MQLEMMEIATTRSERLKKARLNAGLTQAQVATAVGMKQPSYAYLEKVNNAASTKLDEIAKVLNVGLEWLKNGDGSATSVSNIGKLLENSTKPLLNEQKNQEGYVWVDVVNIKFSCGTGESIEFHFNEVLEQVSFKEDFFSKYKVKHDNVRLVYASGDSQEPYVKHGDMFAVDLADTDIKDGEFYAVYFEGEAMLKQIFKEQGNTLVLHSLNGRYRDKIIDSTNGASFKVIGRQFWRAG